MRNIIKVLLNEGIEREDVVAICKYIKEEYELNESDYKAKDMVKATDNAYNTRRDEYWKSAKDKGLSHPDTVKLRSRVEDADIKRTIWGQVKNQNAPASAVRKTAKASIPKLEKDTDNAIAMTNKNVDNPHNDFNSGNSSSVDTAINKKGKEYKAKALAGQKQNYDSGGLGMAKIGKSYYTVARGGDSNAKDVMKNTKLYKEL